MTAEIKFSTGSADLDALLEELQPQDNVVFYVTDSDQYLPFVTSLDRHVAASGAELVYLRANGFLDEYLSGRVVPLEDWLDCANPKDQMLSLIEEIGSAVYYVSDPLSAFDTWFGDERALVDLFLALCPRLFALKSVAYWSIGKDAFGDLSVASIRDCTQIFLKVDRLAGDLRLTPLKVWGRYSEAMFLPHRVLVQDGELLVEPLPLDPDGERAYTEYLEEKSRELASIRDQLSKSVRELRRRNRELAELNARVAHQSRLYESLQSNLAHLQGLFRSGQTIESSLVVDKVQDSVLDATERLFQGAAVRLRVAGLNGSPGCDCQRGGAADRQPLLDGIQRKLRTQVEAEGKVLSLQKEAADGSVLRAAMAPIYVRGILLGTLEIQEASPRLDSEETRMLLEYLASEASIALDNAHLYLETQMQEEQLRSYLDDVIQAEERESRQLAFDLHDGLIQQIVAAFQHLQTAQAWRGRDPGAEDRELARAMQILRQAIQEARHLVSRLRPAGLDDFGLEQALRLFCAEASSAPQWNVSLRVADSWPSLSPSVEASLFRIVQEATANARKYADSDRVLVSLDISEADLVVRVQDTGKGFDPGKVRARPQKGQHIGLIGIQERARLLGGRCLIESHPGEGTTIAIYVPRRDVLEEDG